MSAAKKKTPCLATRGFSCSLSRVMGCRPGRQLSDLHEGRDQRSIDLSDRPVAGCVKEEQQTCKT